MQEFMALANGLADAAAEIAVRHFRQPFQVDSKSDASPVTIADRGIEQRMREMIESARPEDGIIGEEFGTKESRSGLIWVLDPIDGTKSFVIGRPTFGTLIALWEGDKPLLGVIAQPISKELWIGSAEGTLYNGEPVHTRPCASLKEACAASTTPAMFKEPVYEAIEQNTKMMAWGGDCYMYGLLASGYMDLTIEESLSPYDFAALVPIVTGAGGKICDWDGRDLTLKSDGRVVALGDAALLGETLSLLR